MPAISAAVASCPLLCAACSSLMRTNGGRPCHCLRSIAACIGAGSLRTKKVNLRCSASERALKICANRTPGPRLPASVPPAAPAAAPPPSGPAIELSPSGIRIPPISFAAARSVLRALAARCSADPSAELRPPTAEPGGTRPTGVAGLPPPCARVAEPGTAEEVARPDAPAAVGSGGMRSSRRACLSSRICTSCCQPVPSSPKTLAVTRGSCVKRRRRSSSELCMRRMKWRNADHPSALRSSSTSSSLRGRRCVCSWPALAADLSAASARALPAPPGASPLISAQKKEASESTSTHTTIPTVMAVSCSEPPEPGSCPFSSPSRRATASARCATTLDDSSTTSSTAEAPSPGAAPVPLIATLAAR
mmetsp:Transcript_22500/g.57107  ORF Transcript_22500/g.57107 Transcript_22500/m.57107 type:complete len:364 (-) Transcript_22500:50-1141(-)